MRNYRGSYKDSSFSSRSDRRSDREPRFRQNESSYKRPADKGFNRSFPDRNVKPRRDYDNDRSSFNQERRDVGSRNGRGGRRPFADRSFRKPERPYRNPSPPRSRDRENRSDSRINRSSDSRVWPRLGSPPTRRDFPSSSSARPRPSRGGIQSRRGIGMSGSRIIRRNDLRSNLISKRTAPAIRSREYIKKIKQARMKLNESGSSKSNAIEDPQTPPKDHDKEHEDNDDDFLDVANDINFEDEDESAAKRSTKAKSEEKDEKIDADDDEADAQCDNLNVSASNSDERPRRARSEKSPSKESGERSVDLNCIHCMTKCSSIDDYRLHLTRRSHMIAMKKVSIKLRLTLNRLRKVQRDRQLEIEARVKNVEKIASKYCQICKLYFRQSKIDHRESEDHKKIRNFLKPYCKICRVQLLSAMKFEIHKCTLNHLKSKARKHEAVDDMDLHELDLGDFKTVDSVGDVDGEEVESGDNEEEIEATGTALLGQEFVNKIEVNYCSLCREYLPRVPKDEKSVAEHCKTKRHLKWFYQSKKKEEIELKIVEAGKEVVTSTSAQENEAKACQEKEVNTSADAGAADIAIDETQIKKEDISFEGEENEKFVRYFE